MSVVPDGGGDWTPFGPGEVLWQGSPEVAVHLEDLRAGLSMFLLVGGVLLAGLILLFGSSPRAAWELAAPYAGIVAILLTLCRAAGAGWYLSAWVALSIPIGYSMVQLGYPVSSLLCPMFAAVASVGVVLLRLRQRLSTRYAITADHAAVGWNGRYVIVFPIHQPPQILLDRFGPGLGDVLFDPTEGRLTTYRGKVYSIPPRPHVFVRIPHPHHLHRLLRAQRDDVTNP